MPRFCWCLYGCVTRQDSIPFIHFLQPHAIRLFIATAVAMVMILQVSCRSDDSGESATGPDAPLIPVLETTPYITPADVWVSARYTTTHPGVDVSARKDIPTRAMGDGIFHKQMYYHEGVPRWQVNAEITVGKYGIDYLFESGNSVTEAQAKTQFDMLIADGTPVKAGDLLGNLYLAPGQDHSYLHFGVRYAITGQAECLMPYCTPEVRTALLELYRRDNPGGQICYDHVY